MRKGRKPYENKKDIDPGRLKEKVTFFKMVQNDDDSITKTILLDTYCLKEPVSLNSLSQLKQLGMIADQSGFNEFYYITFRKRDGFYPLKDMSIEVNNIGYVLQGVLAQDDPVTFIKILCSRVNLET